MNVYRLSSQNDGSWGNAGETDEDVARWTERMADRLRSAFPGLVVEVVRGPVSWQHGCDEALAAEVDAFANDNYCAVIDEDAAALAVFVGSVRPMIEAELDRIRALGRECAEAALAVASVEDVASRADWEPQDGDWEALDAALGGGGRDDLGMDERRDVERAFERAYADRLGEEVRS